MADTPTVSPSTTLKLAAIDIGSNAIRCQISSVLLFEGTYTFKKLEYVRYPLRLGEDVFATGRIGAVRAVKLEQFLHSMKLLMAVHDVDAYRICATSAMRSSENGREVADDIRRKLRMKIDIIEGDAEAAYVDRILTAVLADGRHYLHIDVGGGSTEFNLYINREKVAAESFEIGSIRRLQSAEVESNTVWEAMKAWVKQNARAHHVSRAIGTGGNIGKIYDMAHRTPGQPIFRRQIEEIHDRLAAMTVEERIRIALLNPDRADVIVPAAHIYLKAMHWAKIESMVVPDVGLKDGILQVLLEEQLGAEMSNYQLAIAAQTW